MSALRHIEGRTWRVAGGYYLEAHVEHADRYFYTYQCAQGYGSQKVWASVQDSLRAALVAIDQHRLQVAA